MNWSAVMLVVHIWSRMGAKSFSGYNVFFIPLDLTSWLRMRSTPSSCWMVFIEMERKVFLALSPSFLIVAGQWLGLAGQWTPSIIECYPCRKGCMSCISKKSYVVCKSFCDSRYYVSFWAHVWRIRDIFHSAFSKGQLMAVCISSMLECIVL